MKLLPSWLSRAPKKSNNRARALNWYEATRTLKGTVGGWNAISGDANSEIRPAIGRLREVSRQLIRNNGHASHARNLIATNVVGDGIIPTIICEDDKTRKKLEGLLEDHFDTTDCDARGKMDLYGLEDLAMKCIFESGEVLLRFRPRKMADGLALPFQIEVLEPDYINTFKDGPMENGNFCIEGIEFDKIGRIVGYHLYNRHPGAQYMTSGMALESKLVPFRYIAHIFRIDRPGQARGVPWLTPVVVKLSDFQDFSYAQLVRQKVAACFAAFITGGDDSTNIDENNLSETGYDTEALEPGMISRLRQGETVEFGSPPPLTDYEATAKVSMREIAAGLDVSYEALTGDLAGVNFSSGRMGWIEFHRAISNWQHKMLMPQMFSPIATWFLESAMLTGALSPSVKVKLKWTTPRREMISPKDEVPYIISSIRAGLMTRSEALRKWGYDPEKVDAEFVTDNERIDKAKLIFDSDPRNRTQNGMAVALPGAANDNGADGSNAVPAPKPVKKTAKQRTTIQEPANA